MNLLFSLPIFSLLPFVFFVLFVLKWFYASSTPQRKQPPCPSKLPVIGNLHQLGLLPHRSLQCLSRNYGPLMMLHLGRKPVLVVSSADAACEIMKTHDLIFSNRPKSSIADKLVYGSKDVGFAPYSEYWRQVRSICVFQLLSNKRIQSFRHVREEETSIMIDKIRRASPSSSGVNLSDMFVTLTDDIICRIALGRKYGNCEKGRKLNAVLVELVELLGVFNIGDYIPWLSWVNRLNGLSAKAEKVSKAVDEFLEGVIEEHKTKKTEGDNDGSNEARDLDFVDILLEVQKENLTGFSIERDSLKAIILDIFVAGTDTTHTVMEWAMAELLRHPFILEKLQMEVRQAGEGKSVVTEDDLGKMPYLRAVIKETLRLHSPTPLLLPRESTQSVRIMGYDIAAGTQVFVNAWAIARDPLLWEKPEEFQPERFLNSDIDFRGFSFELIPFGAGRRGCPGVSFAIAVNELALAKLVHQFNFALPDGAEPQDLDMTEAAGLTIHKKNPMIVVATPKEMDERNH